MKKKISELLQRGLPFDPSIEGIAYDSRKIKKDFLFFAMPGFKDDGTKYLSSAFANGAVAAVVTKGSLFPEEFKAKVFEVEKIRKSLAAAAACFYDFPARSLSILGATGTKGKSSSTFLLESVLQAVGKKTALVGGVELRHPGGHFPASLTTMDALDLQCFLREAVDNGANAAALEVSSHALSLDRIWGLSFDGVIFTNLSEDHLDFYGSMEAYFQAKKKLFASPYVKSSTAMAVNVDDEYGARLLRECSGNWISFGRKSGEVRAVDVQCSDRWTSFRVETKERGAFSVESPLVGEFNVLNLLGVTALHLKLGTPQEKIVDGLRNVSKVPGRLERVETTLPFSVFVDFAHMGHAFENVLHSLRTICKGRLITVFGAGGDRDVLRRVQLGCVAAKMADFSVVTSDNPRTENPLKIIAAIEESFLKNGGSRSQYSIEADRRTAIHQALEMAQAGDVICIVGKGHETGQIIGTQVIPFDDRIEAAAILRELERR